MSYREKSTWVLLLSIGLTHAAYLVWFLQDLSRPAPAFVAVFSLSVMALAALTAIGHIVIYWGTPDDRRDERDWQVENRSVRIAYVVHAVMMFLCIGTVMPMLIAVPESSFNRPIVICHCFYASFVVAELVRYSLSALHYRRSAA